MVPDAMMAAISVGQISMVSYIIEFLIGVGTVYLAVLGAVKLWDIVSTTVSALRADWKVANDRDVSLLRLWKDRISHSRKHLTENAQG